MAEAPKIHADKIVKSKSRSRDARCEEIGERKLSCPFCCRSNLTLCKIVQHHSWEGVSSRYRVGIMCSELGCMYVCTVGIGCFYRHLKAFHGVRKQTPYSAVPVDICDDQTSSDHTGHCLFLSKLHMDKINKKKEEARIAKKKAVVQAREARKKANVEACEVRKAMFKNFKRMENRENQKEFD